MAKNGNGCKSLEEIVQGIISSSKDQKKMLLRTVGKRPDEGLWIEDMPSRVLAKIYEYGIEKGSVEYLFVFNDSV